MIFSSINGEARASGRNGNRELEVDILAASEHTCISSTWSASHGAGEVSKLKLRYCGNMDCCHPKRKVTRSYPSIPVDPLRPSGYTAGVDFEHVLIIPSHESLRVVCSCGSQVLYCSVRRDWWQRAAAWSGVVWMAAES
jgi:hypothetical protein